MEAQLISILETIISSPSVHARWLNTLSYMEYIGARKIIKSQPAGQLNLTLLTHISEEARHALFFKKMSLRVMPDLCRDYREAALLVPSAADRYFQQLDQSCHANLAVQFVEPSLLTYAYVTLLIEERALFLYETYQSILEKNQKPVSLTGVLLEESRHLDEILGLIEEVDPQFSQRKLTLGHFEEQLFAQFMEDIKAELNGLSGEGEKCAARI